MFPFDHQIIILLYCLLGFLAVSSGISWGISRFSAGGGSSPAVRNLIQRINAWWIMFFFLFGASCLGLSGLCLLFAIVSFFCLREWAAIIPTCKKDRSLLFFCFLGLLPFLYLHMAARTPLSIETPAIVLLLAAWIIPLWTALTGITENFTSRVALTIWGIMLCLVSISYIPALLLLPIPAYEGENLKLVFYLILVTELSDVFQYVYGKLLGRRPVAPALSPNKTMEGLVGGGLTAVLIGVLLHPLTPFSPVQAAFISLVIVAAGFLGGLCMSAVKRANGIKDFGALISGHGGMIDRMDSLCFSAPAFFYLVRMFHT